MPTYDLSCLDCCANSSSSPSSDQSGNCEGTCEFEWTGTEWIVISDDCVGTHPSCNCDPPIGPGPFPGAKLIEFCTTLGA